MAGPRMKGSSTMQVGEEESQSKSNDPRIPKGLRDGENLVYQNLLEVVYQRKASGVRPPQVVVVTDMNKDVDDLVALVLLKDLHRLGLIVLKGVVANLKPARTRALATKGALNAMGLSNIPVGVGTDAEVIAAGKGPRVIADYEFNLCPFMAPEKTHLEDGFSLLTKLCQDANRTGKKLTFLLISGLRDINNFSKSHPDLFAATTEKIILQGGYHVETNGVGEDLVAAEDAANNNFDIVAAREFHHYMAKRAIPSVSFTKVAAFATDIPEQLLIDLENTGHPIGKYLHKAQVLMDVAFYKSSCSPDPNKRFRPFMDQQWYLKFKSSYYETPHPAGERLPVGDEVIKYFNKLVAYDALAALAVGGDDILKQLSISRPTQGKKPLHQVMGVAESQDTGINGKPMAQAIRALVRGSLLACQQHIT